MAGAEMTGRRCNMNLHSTIVGLWRHILDLVRCITSNLHSTMVGLWHRRSKSQGKQLLIFTFHNGWIMAETNGGYLHNLKNLHSTMVGLWPILFGLGRSFCYIYIPQWLDYG